MYADKLSMAHSLEVRVPYLDRTVVEYVQRLGANFKVRNGTRKWLHRQVCQNYLPRQILKRKEARLCRECSGSMVSLVAPEASFRICFWMTSSLMFDLLEARASRENSSKLTDHGDKTTTSFCFSLVMLEQWLMRSSKRKVIHR